MWSTWATIYLWLIKGTSWWGCESLMRSLENYPGLTIRISKVRAFKRSGNGYGYRFLFKCDEIPECSGYGSTVAEALARFQKQAKLWVNLVR